MIATETLARLEFDKLLVEISRHAHSSSSVERVHNIHPLGELKKIRITSGQVDEIRALDRSGISLALGSFEDIRPSLELLRPIGAILAPLELLLFIPVLRLFADVARQFAHRDDIPLLKLIEPQLRALPDILEPLVASIDSDGSIMDSASPLLKETRRAKRGLAGRIRKKIEEIIRDSGIEKFLQDDFITQRSGRWVIPVRMDSKGMVKGVVHDVSASGETAFMEPLEIIPFVNELENLNAEEKAEEIRILRQLSSWIREDAEQIAAGFETLLEIDRLNCMARFAIEYDLQPTTLNEVGELRLVAARHPLLLMMQKRGLLTKVEPLGLALGGSEPDAASVMVITGPNAGGKTIALKTAGMLVLMALSGLAVPAGPGSTFPLLDSLLVDIGDEQSIEQSHSTFSAHAARITDVLGRSGARTMVLLDELGAGTEPLQGAAIACGVLHELQQQGSMVIATTHLSDIIGFVHRTPGMINAGMEFDDARFTPLYRLIVGEPGQSHAVEIARRFGMPERVISFARQMLGNAGSEFAGLLTELRQRRSEYEKLCAGLEDRERLLDQRSAELDRRADQVLQIRKEAAEKGWNDAKELISATRRRTNALLEQLKREKRSEIVDELRRTETKLTEQLKPQAVSQELLPLKTVTPGDTVHIRSLGCDGVVLSFEVRSGKTRVRAGRMELDVPLAELAKARAKGDAGKSKRVAAPWKVDVVGSEECELKLIGMRVDEALAELEPFINHAHAAGLRELRIIHGLGSGRLRDAVREELERHPLVEGHRQGEAHEGRDGATVVTLRV
ncbi:MAG: Smr/MutS family protein [Desulfuromonadaceae bacterium]|nr:Smr/MutS family protein [Desulfuromonadaceae bacterium]MDD2850001.1 Smr/MutS family protein [Desulfuromonadaceae bacterium]MDD4129976.1 Smr/MutS family protein [Desulfuromonadaceae bacterium]